MQLAECCGWLTAVCWLSQSAGRLRWKGETRFAVVSHAARVWDAAAIRVESSRVESIVVRCCCCCAAVRWGAACVCRLVWTSEWQRPLAGAGGQPGWLRRGPIFLTDGIQRHDPAGMGREQWGGPAETASHRPLRRTQIDTQTQKTATNTRNNTRRGRKKEKQIQGINGYTV